MDQTVSRISGTSTANSPARSRAPASRRKNIKTDDKLQADAKAQAEKDFTQAAALGQQGAGVIADLSNASLAAAQAQAVAFRQRRIAGIRSQREGGKAWR